MNKIKLLKSNDVVQFKTFRTGNGGRITVALMELDIIDKNLCGIGISFCSPNDEYNKAKGRLIAHNRCKHYRTTIVAPKNRIKEAIIDVVKLKGIKWMSNCTVNDII
jgi:hypothetical protein